MTNETKWSIDPAHAEITFKVRHLMISNVQGKFNTFDASIYTLGKDFQTAEIDLSIDASSIDTGDKKRDEHLRGDEFLDAKNHKQITFVSNTIEKSEVDGQYEIWGALTIKGRSKKIKLFAQLGGFIQDPWGNERVGFSITGKINRIDWGLNWNSIIEAGGVLISEEIAIVCEIELINTTEKIETMNLVENAKIAFSGNGTI